MSTQYVYLIQEREFIKTSENIFKVGKSKQENNKRINQYPKQSKLILQIICDDCDILEKELIILFKNKYNHRKDIGNEYFEGNFEDMIKNIYFTRNNIYDTINYEKIEKEKIKDEKEKIIQKIKNEIKKKEEEKILLNQEREYKKNKKRLLKELIMKQKEIFKKMIIQQKKDELIKELKKIEEENKIKELKQKENDIKKELKQKEDNIKIFVDWIIYIFKNYKFIDGNINTLYLSYCKFTDEKKYIPVNEKNFKILLNNDNKIIPFNIFKEKLKKLKNNNQDIINKIYQSIFNNDIIYNIGVMNDSFYILKIFETNYSNKICNDNKNFLCRRCGYESKLKTDMVKHLNKKNKCEKNINSNKYNNEDLYNLSLIKKKNIKKETKFYCKICNNYFSTEYCLKRHNFIKHKI